MPDALSALRSLGVEFGDRDGFAFRGIRFVGHGVSFDAGFPRGSGLGVRRTTLHRIMAGHARQCGVTLAWEAPVSELQANRAKVGGQAVRFQYLVGADGAQSAIRRWAGLEPRQAPSVRFGFRKHFAVEPWSDSVEVHWAPGRQIYVTPVESGMVGLALLSRDPRLRLDHDLNSFPQLAARLRGARETSVERGAISAMRRLGRVTSGTLALVGDASGSVDAVTGEGMCLAFQQAVALAEALAAGDLLRYERAHARIRRGPSAMAHMLLLLDRFDLLRQRVFSSFSANPDVFSRMLAMHVGASTPGRTAATLATLGWTLLTGPL
jgi:flavin-dependent dehydrogenase